MIEKQKAVIVVGHGSRDKKAKLAFLEVVALIKKKLKKVRIEPAFLQFSSQDVPKALEKLVQEGYKEIVLFPLFLFQGIHVNQDIPDLIKKEKERFSRLNIIPASPLWPDERIVDIAVQRIKERSA
ncbi:MAG TPA: hypothetical protein ENG47_05310 [Candidatus Aerophobetes bacterium]|uniref:Cobalamin biosynthesis protein CbiX n=1 Tax=Aerophobetes bacterium TaxID=2030807 RepID=A0A7V0QSJ5_UNCAE|nr:hypothetical protein [Candidatus Aerophobetes bacterium]